MCIVGIETMGPWSLQSVPLYDNIFKHSFVWENYINPGYGLSLVDTLWNASSYRQPLEQEGTPMT